MKTIFTDKAIELLNKQKGLWYRASEWLILKNFDVLNPIRYELLSDNRESHRNIVKNILMLENSQYHTYCVANSVLGGSFELALIDNAMELNSEIILNLIPLAHLKQPTIIENTEHITNEEYSEKELMDCLDYLFDDSIELENRLKEEIEKYNLKYS